jgi:hypothetical protein
LTPDVELLANAPYVLDLKGDVILTIGSYASIGLQTRLSSNV